MNKYQNPDGWAKAKDEAEIAIKMFQNTRDIIGYFGVPFAIENPSGALSQYLLKDYVKNDTTYCMYGFDYKKPTSIYSNKKIELKKCNHKGKHYSSLVGLKGYNKPRHWLESNSTYANRSSVPPKLIEQIIKETTNV